MKKKLFYLFALICSVSLFISCSDDDEIKSPVAETTFTDANGLSLTYSGQSMVGKQVQFTPQGNKAVITLSGTGIDLSGLVRSTGQSSGSMGVIPGQAITTLNVDLNIDGNKVSFEGTSDQNGYTIAYKGEAEGNSMKLDLNVTTPKNALTGTSWNLIPLDSKDATVPLHIVWKSTHTVQMEGIIKMMIPMIPIEDQTIPKLLSAVLGKVTFLPDVNIKSEYKDNPTYEVFKTSPLNLALYTFVNNQVFVHLNINQIMAITANPDTRASLEEALPQLIAIVLPMLSNGIPVSYAQDGDNMAFYLGYDVMAPLLDVAAKLMEDEEMKATVIELVRENAGEMGFLAVAFVTQILNQLTDIVAATTDVQIGIDMVAAK